MQQLRRLGHSVSLWVNIHRRIVRYTLFGLAGFICVSLIFQLAYPAGRLLPFVKVQGQNLGGQTVDAVTKRLEKDFANPSLKLVTANKTFTATLAEVGTDVDSNNTAMAAARYTLGQRLVPFSSVWVMAFRDTPTQMRYDDERLETFAQRVQQEAFVPAVNASITVKGEKAELVPAKPSKAYPARDVEQKIRSTHFSPKTTITLDAETKAAERTDDEVQSVLKEAQRAVDTPLTLQLDKEKISVDKKTIGSWLDFPEDAKTKRLQLSLKQDIVKKYLEGIQSKIYKAPGTTTVRLMDGAEVGRTAGQLGRGIDADKTIVALTDALKKGKETTLEVPLAAIPPKIVYERSYSGLGGLLADLAASRGYGIAAIEIGGRRGSANGDKQFVAASTYKLFVAYAVFKEIEAGRMSWGEIIAEGKTAERCFDDMIVVSNNPCAKAFANRIGWQNIENMMHGIGLSASTQLSPAVYTTANDLALFLYKLETGSLVSTGDRARLIDAMKRQSYSRQGIPKGTGVTVADKVGDVDGYRHDAAIVYGPKGPYILVVMTYGGSWAGIADVASQVHSFLSK